MTEKRFYQKDDDDWEIFDTGNHLAFAHSGYQAKKIIESLNTLYEENQVLNDKLAVHRLLTDEERMKVSRFIEKIEKEKEELKAENENLKKEFEQGLEVYKDVADANYKHFKLKVRDTLQKHYIYAKNQRQQNLDNAMIEKAYDLMRVTVMDIADELGIDVTPTDYDKFLDEKIKIWTELI